MKPIKNIPLSDKQDASIQQGESLLKYWVICFIAVAWFTRSEVTVNAGYRPAAFVTHDTPGQDSSLINLIGDWFHD